MARLPSEADLMGGRPSIAGGAGGVQGPRSPGGPRIPSLQVGTAASVPSVKVPETKVSDAEAIALAKVGEEVSKLGDTIFKVMEKEREQADAIRADDAFNQLRNKQIDLSLGKENGYIQRRAGDAVNQPILEQWTEKFDESARSIEKGLGSQQQVEKFKARAAIARQEFQAGILRHIAHESDVYSKAVLKTTIETEIRNVGLVPQDDIAAGLSFERVNAAIANESRRIGQNDPKMIAAEQAKAGDALWHARLEAWRVTDPVGALGAFQSNILAIGPEVRVKLAESLYRDAAPVLAAQLNGAGGPPVTATALARPGPEASPPQLIEYEKRVAREVVMAEGVGGRLPRGVRNNNPGNIVSGPTRWEGEIEGADPKYASFASPEAGIRALAKNLLAYQARGLDTVETIIARWAPATENDTAAYVQKVAKDLGVNPREPLNLRDRKTLSALATAIIKHENGVQPYSAETVGSGVDAALTGKSFAYEAKRTPPFAAASVANLTAADALRMATGNPVIDRLPPDQKIGVFQLARTQASQGAAQAREALKGRYVDTVAAYERGLDSPNPPTESELITVFGQFDGTKMAGDLAVARQFGQDVRSVQNLSVTEQVALLASRTPRPGDGFAASQARHEALARAIDTVAKERQQDPAQAVLRNAPQVQQAYRSLVERLTSGQDIAGAAQAYAAATLAEQQRLEISSPQILTKDMVESIAKRFAEPPKQGENVANVMRGIVDQWGKYWPAVGKQLGKVIPPEATVIGLGVTPEAEQLLAETSRMKPEQLRQGFAETDVKDLRERIRDQFAPLQRSMAWQSGGVETFDNFADSAEKIGLAMMQKGMKPKEAAAKAFQALAGFKYDFDDTWRVPRAVLGGDTTVSTLRAGAEAIKRDIGAEAPLAGAKVPLMVPDAPGAVRPADAERQWRDTILSNGFWVTSPGDGGLTLYVKSGLGAQPVLDAVGMPVRRTWSEISAVANAVRAAYMRDLPKRKP